MAEVSAPLDQNLAVPTTPVDPGRTQSPPAACTNPAVVADNCEEEEEEGAELEMKGVEHHRAELEVAVTSARESAAAVAVVDGRTLKLAPGSLSIDSRQSSRLRRET